MDILNCQEQKPNLKSLILEFGENQTNLPLSMIHRFVDENSNLKSLSLHGVNDEVIFNIIQDLLKILNCDHALEEFTLGFDDESDYLVKKIPREKFPDLIEKLKKIHNAKLRFQPNFSCKKLIQHCCLSL